MIKKKLGHLAISFFPPQSDNVYMFKLLAARRLKPYRNIAEEAARYSRYVEY
jgi:hypothetical protein